MAPGEEGGACKKCRQTLLLIPLSPPTNPNQSLSPLIGACKGEAPSPTPHNERTCGAKLVARTAEGGSAHPRLARSRRSQVVLAVYHPLADGRPERLTTATRSVQSPTQGPRNGYQDPATFAVRPRTAHRPTGWQSCLGRLPSPPQNDKIGFPRDWYKFEVPRPLRRPAQTRRAPPAPTSSIEA